MGGYKRRRKGETDASSRPQAKAKNEGEETAVTDDRLESILMEFVQGLTPWTAASPDRTAAIKALCSGTSSVLSLDPSPSSGSSGRKDPNQPMEEDNQDPTTLVPFSTGEATATALAPEKADTRTPKNRDVAGDPESLSNTTTTTRSTNEIMESSEVYGYWMLLGSHILHRLMIEYSTSFLSQDMPRNTSTTVSVGHSYRRVLCYLCHELSAAFLGTLNETLDPENPPSEKTQGNHDSRTWELASTGASRHWQARLVITMAAAIAGHALAPPPTKSRRSSSKSSSSSSSLGNLHTNPLDVSAWAAATLCVERLLEVGGSGVPPPPPAPRATTTTNTKPSASSSQTGVLGPILGTSAHVSYYWRTMARPLLQSLATNGVQLQLLECIHTAFGEARGDWSRERAAMTALHSQSMSAIQSAFVELTKSVPPFTLEGRLPYRRWAPIVLDWYSVGPLLAQSRLVVNSAFDCPPSIPLALLAKWVHWMGDWPGCSTSNNKSGTKALTSSTLDEYLKILSPGAGRKKKVPVPNLPEIMTQTLEYHAQSLVTDGRPVMRNDEDWAGTMTMQQEKTGNDTKNERGSSADCDSVKQDVGFTCYPFMAQFLCDLAKLYGKSDVTLVGLFETAAGAAVLQYQIVSDVKLLYWALRRAMVLLQQMVRAPGNYDHLVTQPLLSSTTTTKLDDVLGARVGGRKRKAETTFSAPSSQPGIHTFCERFALFLRAMHPLEDSSFSTAGRKKSPKSVSVGQGFVHTILSVIEACLDTRTVMDPISTIPTNASAVVRVQQEEESMSTTRRRKRRKKEEPDASSRTVAANDGPLSEVEMTPGRENRTFQPISKERSSLACVALDILHDLLDETHPVGEGFSCLEPGTIGTEELCRIVWLGEIVDKVLLRTPNWEKSVGPSKGNVWLVHQPQLGSSEKQLWDSHMNVSIVAARCRNFHISETRVEVLKAVKNAVKYRNISRHVPDGWPLWLPASHFLLIATNISFERETEAVLSIVNGVLVSVNYVLSHLESLLPINPTTRAAIVVDPEFPLSVQDVQLFLGALMRLSDKQRSIAFIALTKLVCSSFDNIYKDSKSMDLVKTNSAVSGFLARLVTTCSYVALISNCEDDVQHDVMHILSFISARSPSFWHVSRGFHSQGHFLGVFPDHVSSMVPQMSAKFSNEESADLRQIFEISFEMGLSTASNDNGFLMFSAWNAFGKIAACESDTNSLQLHDAVKQSRSLGSLLLVLRENVCFLFKNIKSADAHHDNNSGSSTSSLPLAYHLQLLIDTASELIESLLQLDNLDDREMHLSGEACALAEGLCVALCFAISSITKPKTNFIDGMVAKVESKRQRTYSTESEAGSDGESGTTEDILVEVLDRIETCVSRIGGVPAHPDWLDKECFLRSVSMDEAHLLARKAIDVMARVVKLAKVQQHKAGVASLQLSGSSENSPVRADLALKLVTKPSFSEPRGSDSMDIGEVSRICNVDQKTLRYISENTAYDQCLLAVAKWCGNLTQRIHGRFHVLIQNQMLDTTELGLTELRVGEEWEVSLAFVLASSCMGLVGGERIDDASDELRRNLATYACWERLADTAVSCMVPASALVRLTSFRQGRVSHPYASFEACPEEYRFCQTYLAEQMTSSQKQDTGLSPVLQKSLEALTSTPIYHEPVGELIAANLFSDPVAFLNLRSMASVRTALRTLSDLKEVYASMTGIVDPGFRSIVEREVGVMTSVHHHDIDRTSGLVKLFLTVEQEKSLQTTLSSHFVNPQFFSGDLSHLSKILICLLWECPLLPSSSDRSSVMTELGCLAAMEIHNLGKNEMSKNFLLWLAQQNGDRLKKILKDDLFDGPDQDAESLSWLLASVLLKNHTKKGGKFESTLFDVLFREVREKIVSDSTSWHRSARFETIMHLLCLYGAYCQQVEAMIKFFMEDAKANLQSIEVCVTFLQHLHNPSSAKIAKERWVDNSASAGRSSCSFALREGFYEQHWYNCRTCGLTDEKGCCTLCALICHHGHDISYARFSSFFCDCGAQNGLEGRGTSCKCLASVAKTKLVQARHAGANRHCSEKQSKSFSRKSLHVEPLDYSCFASRAFGEKASDALESSVGLLKRIKLITTIESLFKDELPSWKVNNPTFPPTKDVVVSFEDLRHRMIKSSSYYLPSDTNVKYVDPLITLGTCSKKGTLEMRSAVDPSEELVLRSKLLELNSTRSVLACDSRGRLIVAESGQISIISGGSIPGDEALEGMVLGRGLVPIITSKTTSMKSIIGLAINRHNEKHFLLWGADCACIVLLNNNGTFIEGTVDLNLHHGNSVTGLDGLSKAQWLPRAEFLSSVGRGNCILIFDFSSISLPLKNIKVSPDLKISVHSSLTILDYCLVDNGRKSERGWRVYALLSDGSLHSVEVDIDASGSLTSSLSVIGNDDSRVIMALDRKTSRLDYLRQSRTLVCQGVGGSVTGVVLDSEGRPKKQIRLIPECLHLDEQVDGPYSNFTELGLSRHDGSDYFRLLCTSPVASPKGHIVLSIEFNEHLVRVGRVRKLFGGSIDGAAAFSVPCCIEDEDDEMNLSAQKRFTEKILVCMVDSDGRLSLLCDGCPMISSNRLASFSRRVLDSTYPLLAFERMGYVGGSRLMIHVTGYSSSDLSNKLQRDSESYVVSPGCGGFTMSISLREIEGNRNLIIGGLRLLFGKTSPSCVPRRVYIGGRPLNLEHGVKRWYSVVLTADEIALALRNGFVTITVTQSVDPTSHPILDAVDVFCVTRSAVQNWLPQKLLYLHSSAIVPYTSATARTGPRLSSVKILAALHRMLQPSSVLTGHSKFQVLHELVARTCLCSHRTVTEVEDFVRLIEPENCEQLLDNARLVGCVEFLSNCPGEACSSTARYFWRENSILDCLRLASSIAKKRPMNYTPSLDGTSTSSIASLASIPLTQSLALTLDFKMLVCTFVELCLLEMAVAGSIGHDQSKRGSMGSFAPLRTLLTQRSDAIVKMACDAISRFCTTYSSPDFLGDNYDFFHSSRLMTFACDSCQLTPIRGVRWTLLDANHPFDLCNSCHEQAMAYASTRDFDEATDVVIGDRKVGDPKLTCSEVGRMSSVLMQDHPSTGAGRQQLYDVFLDGLFNGLVVLTSGPQDRDSSSTLYLSRLCLKLIDMADSERRTERKKRIAKEICNGISLSMKSSGNLGREAPPRRNIEMYFRCLSQLMVDDPRVCALLSGKKKSEIVDANEYPKQKAISCGRHSGKPICRKADDTEKFYVCGQDKCNHFVWVTNCCSGSEGQTVSSEFDTEVAQHIWKLLASLHRQISDFIEAGISVRSTKLKLPTAKTYEDEHHAVSDGVLCCRERLFLSVTVDEFVAEASLLPTSSEGLGSQPADGSGFLEVVEKCLETIGLAAGPDADERVTPWFPVLCKILMEGNPTVRSLAKTTLFRICGRNRDRFFAVRDHHGFGIHLKKVLLLAWPLWKQASLLKAQQRRFSPKRSGNENEPGHGYEFVGMHLLLAEDTLSLSSIEEIQKNLKEMMSSAKRRVINWRSFCKMDAIERSVDNRYSSEPASKLFALAPIRALFYLSCLLPRNFPAMVMKLLDLGIPNFSEKKTVDSKTHGFRSVAGDFVEPTSEKEALSISQQELHDFSVHFVLRGASDIRRSAGNVGLKLCNFVKPQDVEAVVQGLVHGPITEVGEAGRAGTEFVALVSNMIRYARWSNGSVFSLAEFLETILFEQLLSVRYDQSNNEYVLEAQTAPSQGRRRFDLSPCLHCNAHVWKRSSRSSSSFPGGDSTNCSTDTGRVTNSTSSPSSLLGLSQPQPPHQKSWINGQVSPLIRLRLESVKESQASSEFATFLTLKYRIVLSDISVDIHEHRGRYVKTIRIYGSSRVVQNVSQLKSKHGWQELGKFSITKGATRASCTFATPFIAANLMIEYCDFFERPGDSRATDGSLLIHCPRCTRVVTNAHGVCGNCGEVAFQCRRCRHINYDRLDAFLCVECGYCASGSFVYEVTGGIASNASAILDERDYLRSNRQLEVSTRLYDDILRCIKDQFLLSVKGSAGTRTSYRADDLLPDGLRWAYASDTSVEVSQAALDLTPESVGGQGSVVKAVCRTTTATILSSPHSDSYRSIALLSGATSSGGSSRRRARDTIIQAGGSERLAAEDESDLLGLLESTDTLSRDSGLDHSDPLSRVLASMQNRRQQQENRARRQASSNKARAENKTKSSKDALAVSEKLYVLLRECEREIFHLKRRISAWDGLHRGQEAEVANFGGQPFTPSHCSTCAGSLAASLLHLWIKLFQFDPVSVAMKESTIRMLLEDDRGLPLNLIEAKHLVLSEIALKSEKGSALVLDMMTVKLRAGHNVNTAELLGQILRKTDGNSALKAKFVHLAKLQLESHYNS